MRADASTSPATVAAFVEHTPPTTQTTSGSVAGPGTAAGLRRPEEAEGPEAPEPAEGGFAAETLAELRKVVWPSRQQLFSETVAVILMVGLSAAAIAAIDRFYHWIASQVFR